MLARPAFALLDRVHDAIKPAQFRQVLQRLTAASITYVTLAEGPEAADLYDAVLEIGADGGWRWKRFGMGSPGDAGYVDSNQPTESASHPGRKAEAAQS
jgi:hypothetical protein